MNQWNKIENSKMKYQDLGGPTPFNYRPDDDSAKLSTTLTPKVRKKLDKICRLFRENRQWKSERQMEKIMLDELVLNRHMKRGLECF